MSTIQYEDWNPRGDAFVIIQNARRICADFSAQGYDLTLRQLYYQFVAEGLIPNNQKSYDKLGIIINRARMSGYLDWNYIVDRTRNLESISHWANPSEILSQDSRVFRLDKWIGQSTRVEVWVEKEALAGVIQRAAGAIDCAWFACRGYVSQSEMWAARNVWEIVERDGIEEACKQLIEVHYGWSQVNATRIDLKGIKVSKGAKSFDYEYGTPEYEKASFVMSYGDGRFVNVPNYGVAYTDTVIQKLNGINFGKPYQQSTADDWRTPDDTADTEWAYVIADNGLWLFKCNGGSWNGKNTPPSFLGIAEWKNPEPNWQEIEDKVYEELEARNLAEHPAELTS